MWRLEDVLAELKKQQGGRSLRAFAEEVGCSAAYLSDVFKGQRQPGPKLLDHLGVERRTQVVTTYVKKRRWK